LSLITCHYYLCVPISVLQYAPSKVTYLIFS
jgi:hypothetical protein